jgi:hypothetical protein
MNHKLLYACFACAISAITFGQTQDIIDWQSTHPTVSFIEKSDFVNFSDDEISNLNNNYVLFEESIKFEDLLAFDEINSEENNLVFVANVEVKKSESQFIKDWLATHAEVKIIKNSEYLSLSENQKNEYTSAHALILSGEFLTRADIITYPY